MNSFGIEVNPCNVIFPLRMIISNSVPFMAYYVNGLKLNDIY